MVAENGVAFKNCHGVGSGIGDCHCGNVVGYIHNLDRKGTASDGDAGKGSN